MLSPYQAVWKCDPNASIGRTKHKYIVYKAYKKHSVFPCALRIDPADRNWKLLCFDKSAKNIFF